MVGGAIARHADPEFRDAVQVAGGGVDEGDPAGGVGDDHAVGQLLEGRRPLRRRPLRRGPGGLLAPDLQPRVLRPPPLAEVAHEGQDEPARPGVERREGEFDRDSRPSWCSATTSTGVPPSISSPRPVAR